MERRRFLRVTVDAPSHVAGEAPSEADVVGKCYSLGGGGFGFLFDRPFEVGAWLAVEIELVGGPINARAVVVSCGPANDGSGNWNTSTKLTELPDEDLRRLNEALHESS